MYFIVEGKLRVLHTFEGKDRHTILTSPSWIGDLCLFREMVRSKTVVSFSNSELLRIDREVIERTISEFPKIAPIYQSFQRRIAEGELISAGVKCAYCGGFGHFVADCDVFQNYLRESLVLGDEGEKVRTSMAGRVLSLLSGRSTSVRSNNRGNRGSSAYRGGGRRRASSRASRNSSHSWGMFGKKHTSIIGSRVNSTSSYADQKRRSIISVRESRLDEDPSPFSNS